MKIVDALRKAKDIPTIPGERIEFAKSPGKPLLIDIILSEMQDIREKTDIAIHAGFEHIFGKPLDEKMVYKRRLQSFEYRGAMYYCYCNRCFLIVTHSQSSSKPLTVEYNYYIPKKFYVYNRKGHIEMKGEY